MKSQRLCTNARDCDVSFTPGFSPVSNDDKKRGTVKTALIYLTHYGNGSATLMRGKSATCRRRSFFSFGSSTRHGQRPFRIKGATYRQVRDLPRIRVAEPLQRSHRRSTESRAESSMSLPF